jgi:L-rhamnose isomerase
MTDLDRRYDLPGRLRETGRNLQEIERAVSTLVIETPSWGYGDSGTSVIEPKC